MSVNFKERMFDLGKKIPWFSPRPTDVDHLKHNVAHAEAWLRLQVHKDYLGTVEALFVDLRQDALNVLSVPSASAEDERRAIAALRIIRLSNQKIIEIVRLGQESAAKLKAIADKEGKNDA